MREMKEYDLFIPIAYNNGVSVGVSELERIRDDLIDKFRGLSIFRGACQGYWRDGHGQVVEDQNFVCRVVAEDNADVREYMFDLKVKLESLLKQESIFIIVRDVEIL